MQTVTIYDELHDPEVRLSRDLRDAARTLTEAEARYLVDYYYQLQGDRIRAGNRSFALTESGEPHTVIAWLGQRTSTLELQIKRALDAYSDGHPVGQWARSIVGIGPVIASGLLSHIDITKAPTAGHIWRFAGLDPTVSWGKKEKRPWNARLKTLCWKIGESFVKVSGHERDVYGKLYLQRKAREIEFNLRGEYAEQAVAALAAKRLGDDTDARAWYEGRFSAETARTFWTTEGTKRAAVLKAGRGEVESGVRMLPPARLHLRAQRWAVKLFLAHYQAVAYRTHFGVDAPKPYAMTQAGGHAHEIVCPNWPF